MQSLGPETSVLFSNTWEFIRHIWKRRHWPPCCGWHNKIHYIPEKFHICNSYFIEICRLWGWGWYVALIIGYPFKRILSMMKSSNGNVTGPLCGEFTGHRWIPPHKGKWRETFMFYLICAWINGWVNNREAGDFRRPLWRHCNEHAID